MFQTILLYSDLLVALGITGWVIWRGWLKGDGRTVRLFILGLCLGSLWEFPLYWLGPEYSTQPPYRLLIPFPVAPWLQPISHSIWDGGLFLIGVWWAQLLIPHDIWERFYPLAFIPLLSWGILSAILIEIIGSLGIWEYIPKSWNPEMFTFQGKSITALAPITWGIAPVLHYLLGGWWLRKRTLF